MLYILRIVHVKFLVKIGISSCIERRLATHRANFIDGIKVLRIYDLIDDRSVETWIKVYWVDYLYKGTEIFEVTQELLYKLLDRLDQRYTNISLASKQFIECHNMDLLVADHDPESIEKLSEFNNNIRELILSRQWKPIREICHILPDDIIRSVRNVRNRRDRYDELEQEQDLLLEEFESAKLRMQNIERKLISVKTRINKLRTSDKSMDSIDWYKYGYSDPSQINPDNIPSVSSNSLQCINGNYIIKDQVYQPFSPEEEIVHNQAINELIISMTSTLNDMIHKPSKKVPSKAERYQFDQIMLVKFKRDLSKLDPAHYTDDSFLTIRSLHMKLLSCLTARYLGKDFIKWYRSLKQTYSLQVLNTSKSESSDLFELK